MPKLGVYTREIMLAKPDWRSKQGRLLKQIRTKFINALGGESRVSPGQRVLVERAAMLQLRLAILDERILEGTFTEYDSKTYCAWSNSMVRTLQALGLTGNRATENKNTKERAAISLQDYESVLREVAGSDAA